MASIQRKINIYPAEYILQCSAAELLLLKEMLQVDSIREKMNGASIPWEARELRPFTNHVLDRYYYPADEKGGPAKYKQDGFPSESYSNTLEEDHARVLMDWVKQCIVKNGSTFEQVYQEYIARGLLGYH